MGAREFAGYAERVIPRLAKRFRINERVLYRCAQFHRRFPILNHRSELVWSHYRLLCQVDDDKQCAALTAQAEKRGWTRPELEIRVRQLSLENIPPPDKNDRHLADVFLEGNFSPLSALDSQPREAPVFLIHALPENGHALRMDGDAPHDCVL
ncbi:MAG: hypothetical protein HY736_25370 [Verrucomicrobia bacterium]|nr:hypothetical protein [Verrucomicrobiota bacterium]